MSEGAVPAKTGWKRRLLTALQLLVTVGVLALVFRDPEKRAEMARVLPGAAPGWLVAGFLAYFAGELVAVERWRVLLQVQGIVLGWWRLTALVFIGVFFNFFIPGGTGGDVVKVFYLLKETPGKRGPAVLSVLVDRLAGVIGLCLFAWGLALAQWSWLTHEPAVQKWVWLGLGILGSSLGGLHATYIITRHGWVHRLPARMPGRDRLAEIAMAYHLYGRAWSVSLWAVVLSVISNFGYFVTFYCAGRALEMPGMRVPTLLELSTLMPLINTIAALPISLGGVGVREHLFEIFYTRLCGVSGAVAVLISSLGYLLTLAFGLVGGVIYLCYRPSDHPRLREIEAEVRAVEHEVAEEEIALEEAADPKQP